MDKHPQLVSALVLTLFAAPAYALAQTPNDAAPPPPPPAGEMPPPAAVDAPPLGAPPPPPPAPMPPPAAVATTTTTTTTSSTPPAVLPAEPPPPVVAKFSAQLYGFVEADAIHDSTESFNDAAGNANIQHGNYAGKHQRTIFGARNSRFGIRLKGPDGDGFKSLGVIETDFLGTQANPPATSESTFFASPLVRMRHAYLRLDTPYVDILFGQTWQLFGWQTYFHPNTVEIQGVPGEIFSRSPQLRLSHSFKTDAVTVDVALAAARPPQRDSSIPDFQGGVRLVLNNLKALHTAGSTGTAVDPAGIGISGVYRHFQAPQFVAMPAATQSVSANGGGISIDALIPIIPAQPSTRANALTLTGSYVNGTGLSDLYTGLTGGVGFPAVPGTMTAYANNVDPGLATFDAATGTLHTINWWSFIVGAQYYLPPAGQLWVSANFSMMKSSNIGDFNAGNAARIFNKSMWADGNLFYDVNKAIRFGGEFAWFKQFNLDGTKAVDLRGQISGFYIF